MLYASTNEFFVEIRATAQRSGKPRLVPLAEVPQQRGLRSICSFPTELVELIREQGGTHNLRGYAVYADTMFMDFDGHDPVKFREWLKSSGLGYTEWDSGNRSVHFHIPIEPLFETWVTDAMKAWTKEHAPTADTSFLHNAGMYRLPGTYHHKTGRQKTLVETRDGPKLTLIQPPASEFETPEGDGTLEQFFTLLTTHKAEGARAPWLWRLGMAAAEAGLTYNEALDHLRWWNENLCTPPRDDLTVQRQCQSAYKRQSTRKIG